MGHRSGDHPLERRQRVRLARPVLSVRQRAMRGKRTAMPDLWRGESGDALEGQLEDLHAARPTAPARTARTVWRRTQPSSSRISSSAEPRVRLGDRHQLALVPDGEGVVGEQVRPPAVARAGRRPARRRSVKGSIFHFHQSPRSPAGAVGRVEALQHQPLDACARAPRAARPRQLLPGRPPRPRRDEAATVRPGEQRFSRARRSDSGQLARRRWPSSPAGRRP